LAVNKKLKKVLEDFGSKVKVEYVEFGHIKKMYGAAHCATQVFRKDWWEKKENFMSKQVFT